MRRKLAHEHTAGGTELLRDDRVRRSDVVAQDLRMRGRRQARIVDDVFQAIGHAVQRAAPVAARDLAFRTPRILECDFRREAQKRIELFVVLLDAVDQRFRVFDRRKLLAT
jgi:hypothetical protein